MAAIAAVQMQLPNPPAPNGEIEPIAETMRRAGELHRSGLLKFWDRAKHPRTGTSPNPGWFAPVPEGSEAEGSEAPNVVPVSMVERPGTPLNEALPTGGAPGIGGGIPSTPSELQPEPAAPVKQSQHFHFPVDCRRSSLRTVAARPMAFFKRLELTPSSWKVDMMVQLKIWRRAVLI